MEQIRSFFAPAPKGMEALLAEELRQLGARSVRPARAGVSFRGPLETGYRVCLWSRIASRVLLSLTGFPASDPQTLYAGIREIPWERELDANGSLAVSFNASASAITHTHFGALKVKDAVVDRLRDLFGVRPSVDVNRPDVRINVSLNRDIARVALDLAGEALHRRGYREAGAPAPLKENLAAALLMLSGWSGIARRGGAFVDPMCGSGTLVIEAAWIAADHAPGLLRDYFGFLGWKGHEPELWGRLRGEAEGRAEQGLTRLPEILGFDLSPQAVRAARDNLSRAGLAGRVHIERRPVDQARPPAGVPPGLLLVNPPYGERMGVAGSLPELYAGLGRVVKRHFGGWQVGVFTTQTDLARHLDLPVSRVHTLYNGAMECHLYRFASGSDALAPGARGEGRDPPWSAGAEMLANRLRKNRRHLRRWLEREAVDCYRLYDADLPEYALAVDVYRGERTWVHAQEYQAPASVDADKARQRLAEALMVISRVLAIPSGQVILKVRRRQKGDAQYGRLGERGMFHAVRESGCVFLVNFTDYLDTGLFLDHRLTRALLGRLARGGHFLNLFGYTGSATVLAARRGAASTTTVDMSRTYLEWARRNLAANGIEARFGAADGAPHRLIQADCLVWLNREAGAGGRRYDLIFLDPPTFSNSRRMAAEFDIQRDHVALIRASAGLLAPGGRLIFSTNRRRFKLDTGALAPLQVKDITGATTPPDFQRRGGAHRCWQIMSS